MNQFSSALKAEGRLDCRRPTRKYTRAVSYLLFEAVQLHRNIRSELTINITKNIQSFENHLVTYCPVDTRSLSLGQNHQLSSR